MAVGTWQLYKDFLYRKSLDQHRWGVDQYSVILTNDVFSIEDAALIDITQITDGNGYLADGINVSTYSLQDINDSIYKASQAKWLASGSLSAKSAIVFNTVNNWLAAYCELNVGSVHSVSDGNYFTVDMDINGIFKTIRS